MSGFLALMNAAPADIEKVSSAIANCDGKSAEMAVTMQDNLAGQLTILKSQLEELAISFGEILMPAIRQIVTWVQGFVDKLNGMDEGTKNTIVTIGLLAAAIGPVLIVIGKVVSAVGSIMTFIPTLIFFSHKRLCRHCLFGLRQAAESRPAVCEDGAQIPHAPVRIGGGDCDLANARTADFHFPGKVAHDGSKGGTGLRGLDARIAHQPDCLCGIFRRKSQSPGNGRTVFEGLSHHGDVGVRIGTGRRKDIRKMPGIRCGQTESVGTTLTKSVTTPIVGLGTVAVKTAADFDTDMSQVGAVSGATGKDLDALRDKAREMGSKTKFSASEAAEAMNYMAMAGWKTSDMLSGIEGIMNLAAASGEDLATTSDIVTDALTAFGLTAADSGHFADILAAESKVFPRCPGNCPYLAHGGIEICRRLDRHRAKPHNGRGHGFGEGGSHPPTPRHTGRAAQENEERMEALMRKKVFICSPFRGDMEGNARRAAAYSRMACEEGYLPIAPHLLFPHAAS